MSSDERLTVPQVAALLGVTTSTWRAYVTRGQAPEPDGRHSVRVPWWWRSRIEQWQASRKLR